MAEKARTGWLATEILTVIECKRYGGSLSWNARDHVAQVAVGLASEPAFRHLGPSISDLGSGAIFMERESLGRGRPEGVGRYALAFARSAHVLLSLNK